MTETKDMYASEYTIQGPKQHSTSLHHHTFFTKTKAIPSAKNNSLHEYREMVN